MKLALNAQIEELEESKQITETKLLDSVKNMKTEMEKMRELQKESDAKMVKINELEEKQEASFKTYRHPEFGIAKGGRRGQKGIGGQKD